MCTRVTWDPLRRLNLMGDKSKTLKLTSGQKEGFRPPLIPATWSFRLFVFKPNSILPTFMRVIGRMQCQQVVYVVLLNFITVLILCSFPNLALLHSYVSLPSLGATPSQNRSDRLHKLSCSSYSLSLQLQTQAEALLRTLLF